MRSFEIVVTSCAECPFSIDVIDMVHLGGLEWDRCEISGKNLDPVKMKMEIPEDCPKLKF